MSRPQLEERAREGRVLLFGRRKTGKTSLARRVREDALYTIVSRGGNFYLPSEGTVYSWQQFRPILEGSNSVIVDEFHRAPEEFFLHLQAGNIPERVALLTSTLHYFRKFVEERGAPLAGLFSPIHVSLLEPVNLLRDLSPRTKEDFELCAFYQEPILLGKSLDEIILSALDLSSSLLSEALTEEDIGIRMRFWHVLQAVAEGKTTPSEISSYMFSRGLLERDSPANVMKYITLLQRSGFLRKITPLGTKRAFYHHVSPLTHLAFYLEGKYEFYEADLGVEFGRKVLKNLMSFYIERFVERYFSEVFGLKPVRVMKPETDVALMRFQRLYLVAEVKWKEKVDQGDVKKVEGKFAELERIFGDIDRKILVVPDAGSVPESELEVWDVNTFREDAKKKKYVKS